jgi:hypothetical protein
MVLLKRQISESEKEQVLAQQRRNEVLYCFDRPVNRLIERRTVEFHHIKPFSEDGPTEVVNIPIEWQHCNP